MLSSFRKMSKSPVGTIVSVLFIGAIFASFALADMSSLGGGRFGNSGALATVGGKPVSEREFARVLERRLSQLRQEQPTADYPALAGDFDPLLDQLVQLRALEVFGDRNQFVLSKRLVDGEIANLPGARGLDGKVSDASYANFLREQRLSDAEVRTLVAASLRERLLLATAVANPRLAVGVATPYASMMLEERSGEIATLPTAHFAAGIAPTEAELAGYYARNKRRYLVPEQRVLKIARLGPEAVASVTASEAQIAAAYKAEADKYAGKDVRVITQAVVPSQAIAKTIADAARAGRPMAEAVRPAGLGAEDISVGPQTRAQFAALAGETVAGQAFAAAKGGIVGPVKSDLGWHVIRIDDIQRDAGKTLDQVRGEIAARLTAQQRQEALVDLVGRIEDEIANGASLSEAAASAKLAVVTTPAVTAGGKQVATGQDLDPALRPALKTGFELQADDDPVVETLPEDQGFLLVGVDRVLAAAPAPMAQVRAQLTRDFIADTARERATKAGRAIAALVERGTPLAEAVRRTDAKLPAPEPIRLRRLNLAQFGEQTPPPLRALFALATGKSRLVADPEGRALFVVKAVKITPGNAATQPSLIASTQAGLQASVAQEYAEQFLRAVTGEVGAKRDSDAIAAARQRIIGGGTR